MDGKIYGSTVAGYMFAFDSTQGLQEFGYMGMHIYALVTGADSLIYGGGMISNHPYIFIYSPEDIWNPGVNPLRIEIPIPDSINAVRALTCGTDGLIYIGTGMLTGDSLAHLYCYTPSTQVVTYLGQPLPKSRINSLTTGADGKIYGGLYGGTPDEDFFVYDPVTSSITILGEVMANHDVGQLTVGMCGRIYGFVDGWDPHLFSYDPAKSWNPGSDPANNPYIIGGFPTGTGALTARENGRIYSSDGGGKFFSYDPRLPWNPGTADTNNPRSYETGIPGATDNRVLTTGEDGFIYEGTNNGHLFVFVPIVTSNVELLLELEKYLFPWFDEAVELIERPWFLPDTEASPVTDILIEHTETGLIKSVRGYDNKGREIEYRFDYHMRATQRRVGAILFVDGQRELGITLHFFPKKHKEKSIIKFFPDESRNIEFSVEDLNIEIPYNSEKEWLVKLNIAGEEIKGIITPGEINTNFFENIGEAISGISPIMISGLESTALDEPLGISLLPLQEFVRLIECGEMTPEMWVTARWWQKVLDFIGTALADVLNPKLSDLYELASNLLMEEEEEKGESTEEESSREESKTFLTEKQDSFVPQAFVLNHPNPFTQSTIISYMITNRSHVLMDVYNLSGQKVRTLVDDNQQGSYEITWDGRDSDGKVVSPGIYFCKLKAGSFKKIKKILFLKGKEKY